MLNMMAALRGIGRASLIQEKPMSQEITAHDEMPLRYKIRFYLAIFAASAALPVSRDARTASRFCHVDADHAIIMLLADFLIISFLDASARGAIISPAFRQRASAADYCTMTIRPHRHALRLRFSFSGKIFDAFTACFDNGGLTLDDGNRLKRKRYIGLADALRLGRRG